MLDLARMQRIRLSTVPGPQIALARGFLWPNYRMFPGVDIVWEGDSNLPERPVIIAMNHTDRYNYLPFMWDLRNRRSRFCATWVKGKYYENSAVGWFMENTNNIPTVSRGYLITRDFIEAVGRRPSNEEYACLRAAVDAVFHGEQPDFDKHALPPELLITGRNPLGVAFDPERQSYPEYINSLFAAMMARFVELNAEALDLGLYLQIFPQGTRSKRLSRGHIGLAQIALKYKADIVPVGCNGSDRLYPSSSPLAKAGRVVYRVGEPIRYESLSKFHISEDFAPFSAHAERTYRSKFQGAVDVVMDRINDLLDPEYQYAENRETDGVVGTHRFV